MVGEGAEMIRVTGVTLEELVSEFKDVQEWWGYPAPSPRIVLLPAPSSGGIS